MSGLVVTVDGVLTIQRSDCNPGCPPPGQDLTIFPISLFAPGLCGISGANGSEISQGCFTINSPGAFVDLAFPDTLRATIFFLRALHGSTPLDVQLTHEASGVITYPDQYLMLLQFDAAEQISAAAVQGIGSFSWAAIGVLV